MGYFMKNWWVCLQNSQLATYSKPPLTANSFLVPHIKGAKWGCSSPCWMMPCSCNARHSSSPWRRLSASPFWRSQSISWQPGKEHWYATPCSSLSCRMEFFSPMRLKTQIWKQRQKSDASTCKLLFLNARERQSYQYRSIRLLCCSVWNCNQSVNHIGVCDHDKDWHLT